MSSVFCWTLSHEAKQLNQIVVNTKAVNVKDKFLYVNSELYSGFRLVKSNKTPKTPILQPLLNNPYSTILIPNTAEYLTSFIDDVT